MISRRQIIEQQQADFGLQMRIDSRLSSYRLTEHRSDADAVSGRVASQVPSQIQTSRANSRDINIKPMASSKKSHFAANKRHLLHNKQEASPIERKMSNKYSDIESEGYDQVVSSTSSFTSSSDPYNDENYPSIDKLSVDNLEDEEEDQFYRRDQHHHLLDDALGTRDKPLAGNKMDARCRQAKLYPSKVQKCNQASSDHFGQQNQSASKFPSKMSASINQEPIQFNDHPMNRRRTSSEVRPLDKHEPVSSGELDDYRNFDPYSVYADHDDEDDVWYSEERLFEDHIQEIVDKWHSIDDEIWAKIICMERNRRIAKAYARQHQITINGSRDDYIDGTTLGLNSFDNPDRDPRTNHIKQYIGQGLQLTIRAGGDIELRRQSKANVFIHSLAETNLRDPPSEQAWKSYRKQHGKYLNESGFRQAAAPEDWPKVGDESSEFYGVVGHNRKPASFLARSNATHLQQVEPRTAANSLSPESNGYRFTKLHMANKSLLNSSSGISSSGSSSANNTYKNQRASLVSKLGPAKHETRLGPHQAHRSKLIRLEETIKVFDMAKFKLALERETRKPSPNRSKLRNMCISVISFVLTDEKLLNLPAWIMIINIVALDLLSSEIGMLDPQAGLPMLNTSSAFLDQQPRDPEKLELCCEPLDADYNYLDYHECDTDHRNAIEPEPTDAKTSAGPPGLDGRPNKSHLKHSSSAVKQVLKASQPFASDFQHGESDGSAKNLHKSERAEKISTGPGESLVQGLDLEPDQPMAQQSVADQVAPPAGEAHDTASSFFQDDETEPSCPLLAADVPPRPLPAPKSRGKRPPKLPHGISALSQLQDNIAPAGLVSKPIQIPAPPSSGATGPSGRAHLILVSPTGLSPPMPKRRSDLATSRVVRGPEPEKQKPGPEQAKLRHPGLAGSRLAKQAASLPEGIPPHAQLAPPATQWHILRYLMSHNANTQPPNGRPTSLDQRQSRDTQSVPIVQRPLPVLPPVTRRKLSREHKLAPQSQQARALKGSKSIDESLYYCGLQARVPQANPKAVNRQPLVADLTNRHANNRYPMMMMLMSNQKHLSQSSSAINANPGHNFKLANRYMMSNQQQLSNLNKKYPSTQGIDQCPDLSAKNEGNPSVPRSMKTSSKKPMFRFFKRSSSSIDNDDITRFKNSSKNIQVMQPHSSGAKLRNTSAMEFTSLEDLSLGANKAKTRAHDEVKSSFLNHVGGFLKRSNKKESRQQSLNESSKFEHPIEVYS